MMTEYLKGLGGGEGIGCDRGVSGEWIQWRNNEVVIVVIYN